MKRRENRETKQRRIFRIFCRFISALLPRSVAATLLGVIKFMKYFNGAKSDNGTVQLVATNRNKYAVLNTKRLVGMRLKGLEDVILAGTAG